MFNNREISVIVWFVIFVVFVSLKKQVRKSFVDVVRCIFKEKILIWIISLIFYYLFFIVCFSKATIWNNVYLKDILVWCIFEGIAITSRAINIKNAKEFFILIIKDCINFAIIYEFLINLFVFNIYVELLLVPFIAFLTMLIVVAESKREYQIVSKFLNGVLSILGISILVYVTVQVCTNYNSIITIDNIVSFTTPIIMTVITVPISYIWALISSYEQLLIRHKKTDGEYEEYKKLMIKKCKFSVNKVLKERNR